MIKYAPRWFRSGMSETFAELILEMAGSLNSGHMRRPRASHTQEHNTNVVRNLRRPRYSSRRISSKQQRKRHAAIAPGFLPLLVVGVLHPSKNREGWVASA